MKRLHPLLLLTIAASSVLVAATVRAESAVVPAARIAIVGDSAGRIVAVHASDGTLAWDFDAGGGFTGSPAVAAGHLVMASDDGTLWCFGGTK